MSMRSHASLSLLPSTYIRSSLPGVLITNLTNRIVHIRTCHLSYFGSIFSPSVDVISSSAALAICFSILSSCVVFSCCRLCLNSSCFCCLDNCVCHAPSSTAVASPSSTCSGDSARFFTFFFLGDLVVKLSSISALAVSVSLSLTSLVAGLGDYTQLPYTHQTTCDSYLLRVSCSLSHFLLIL